MQLLLLFIVLNLLNYSICFLMQSYSINNNILYSLTNEQIDKMKELGSPLLDYTLVKSTLEEWNRPLPVNYLTSPLIISGPSGVGKNRMIKALLKDYNKFFQKVITHTTRNPRPDEKNGTNYYYITKEEFVSRINRNEFIEWSKVHDNYYGVSVHAWIDAQQIGKISILEIDIQGVKKIKHQSNNIGITPYYIFISPPNIDKLRERLNVRGTESVEQIEIRIRNAYKEVEQSKESNLFDKIIVNDDFNDAVNTLFRTIRDWYPLVPPAAGIRMMQRRLKTMMVLLKSSSESNNNEIIKT